MNGSGKAGQKLKTVLFCLEKPAWQDAARELAKSLEQSKVSGIFCTGKMIQELLQCAAESDMETWLLRSMPAGESGEALQQLLIVTDSEAAAMAFTRCGIPCIGCADASCGYFRGAGLVTAAPDALSAEELEEYLFHYRGWPVTVAETERLILREIAEKDAERLYEISRQSCMRYLQDAMDENFFRRENLLSYIKEAYRLQGYGLWSVFRKGDGEEARLIGCCGLAAVTASVVSGTSGAHQAASAELSSAFETIAEEDVITASQTAPKALPARLELQYMLDEKYHGCGYGTEMCRAALRYAFTRTDYDAVWLRVHPENRASLRLAEKLGFCEVGVDAAGIRCLKKMLLVY